jgi:hypothetical protein
VTWECDKAAAARQLVTRERSLCGSALLPTSEQSWGLARARPSFWSSHLASPKAPFHLLTERVQSRSTGMSFMRMTRRCFLGEKSLARNVAAA